MMNQLNLSFFLTFFLFSCFSCVNQSNSAEEQLKSYQFIVDSIRLIHTPDQRVDRFRPEIAFIGPDNCVVLRGFTTNKGAKAALINSLQAHNLCFYDSLRPLPEPALGADTFGIINVSVANLRTQPKHSGELTTQALLGMPLKVFDRQDHWFLVQTPDNYIAWLEEGAFVRGNQQWQQSYYGGSLVYLDQQPSRGLTDQPNGGTNLRDMTPGSILKAGDIVGDFQQIILPDGTIGYLPTQDLRSMAHWKSRAEELDLALIARRFYGKPYLWGGTSAKGMDCSGFTKMTYLLNGFVIPRDASQQVHAGTEVAIITDNPAYDNEDLASLRLNDLLFFGNVRKDGSQRISHVGIYLGNGRFVHAGADNGFIREESLFTDATDYAPHRRESLLRAKRLSVGSPGVKRLNIFN